MTRSSPVAWTTVLPVVALVLAAVHHAEVVAHRGAADLHHQPPGLDRRWPPVPEAPVAAGRRTSGPRRADGAVV
ncbi:hypothetical protein SAMN04488546_1863 [Geodermatophilus poikilotrophus]|uniref:Uncharacterized protein n=1 Tax=Geodermatophilus poikilotrophus TaxID=1333667 RepID=A0A1I0D2N9_9ACTN|nr:hypothetical protein SAMN04488546_1863 [Geodermatophilus poikilotrophus]